MESSIIYLGDVLGQILPYLQRFDGDVGGLESGSKFFRVTRVPEGNCRTGHMETTPRCYHNVNLTCRGCT